MLKLLSIVGARPQFIKAAAIHRAIQKYPSLTSCIVHTGQHFDDNMSAIFFEQLELPSPHYFLNINNKGHSVTVGRMLEKLESVLLIEQPDWVLVYGDTNSTLAGALACKQNKFKLAHIEAGLRSFNMDMPEELNRILTDRISDVLFCPTKTSVENLKNEGYESLDCKIVNCGDVMLDNVLFYSKKIGPPKTKLPSRFVLATIHRESNTALAKLSSILEALNKIYLSYPVIMPVHPRTQKAIEDAGLEVKFQCIEPVGYLEMLYLLKNASLIITDSGGVQKEAFFLSKNCLITRTETEWIELVNDPMTLVGADTEKIITGFRKLINTEFTGNVDPFGNGTAAERIIETLADY